jgi:hypothetical protein
MTRHQRPSFKLGRFASFLFSSVLFTLAFAALRYFMGSITGIPGLDNLCYWLGLAFFFYAYVLTDYAFRWAEKYCGFIKK